MKKIIVDIDNTLWDFAPVLYERIKKVEPRIGPPKTWHVFDFWKPFISPGMFYSIIKDIHMEQGLFTPYPESPFFLSSLKEMGFHIVIASHRENVSFDVTKKWLHNKNLVFDELHVSNNKAVLFNECVAIVDDSPFTLQKASAAGMIATGLKMPWNKDDDYVLFDNLSEIIQYLKNQIP